MKNVIYFRDLFESIPDYRKIVFLIFLIINDIDFLEECGFFKKGIKCLYSVFKNILIEQIEE